MGYAERHKAARLHREFLAHVFRGAEAAVALADSMAGIAGRSLRAVDGELELSPQEILDYRRVLETFPAAADAARASIATWRAVWLSMDQDT